MSRNGAAAAKPGRVGAITADYLCAALNAHISEDDIVVNEAIRNTFPVLNQMVRTKPETYISLAGGGLGFSGGAALGAWLREQHARLSPNNQVAKAIAYSLNAWHALSRFLDDGRLCMTNNAAERALRCIAVGRNNWTFAGSDNGGRRAAAIYTLIETAKLNDVDPQAWLADVLARLHDHPARRIAELLPWNWKLLQQPQQRAAA